MRPEQTEAVEQVLDSGPEIERNGFEQENGMFERPDPVGSAHPPRVSTCWGWPGILTSYRRSSGTDLAPLRKPT
jgi:hypothetical protein